MPTRNDLWDDMAVVIRMYFENAFSRACILEELTAKGGDVLRTMESLNAKWLAQQHTRITVSSSLSRVAASSSSSSISSTMSVGLNAVPEVITAIAMYFHGDFGLSEIRECLEGTKGDILECLRVLRQKQQSKTSTSLLKAKM